MTTHKNLTKTTLATGGAVALLAAAVLGGGAAVAQDSGDQGAGQQQTAVQNAAAATSKKLPTITDTWSKTWQEQERIEVSHPKYGELEVRTYFQQASPAGAAPNTGYLGYAVYQDGRPTGFVASPADDAVGGLSAHPQFSVPAVKPAEGAYPNQDKQGNVYLFTGTSVVILHPTEKGFDSEGTLPGGQNPKYQTVQKVTLDHPGPGGAILETTDQSGKPVTWVIGGPDFREIPEG